MRRSCVIFGKKIFQVLSKPCKSSHPFSLYVLLALVLLVCQTSWSQEKHRVYLIPGQGSDFRVFDSLKLDAALFDTTHVHFILPDRKESMLDYARRMSAQIDTSQNFSLIGVSLGGMISSEIMTFLKPMSVIIISSAACRKELPVRYKFQRRIPLYAIVPKGLIKAGAFILQPIFEPDRKTHKATFKAMLKAKDKRFLKRTVRMIIHWDKEECSTKVYHIHGDNDHTLPIKHISADVVIDHGSHMMTLTRAEEINPIIEQFLKDALD